MTHHTASHQTSLADLLLQLQQIPTLTPSPPLRPPGVCGIRVSGQLLASTVDMPLPWYRL